MLQERQSWLGSRRSKFTLVSLAKSSAWPSPTATKEMVSDPVWSKHASTELATKEYWRSWQSVPLTLFFGNWALITLCLSTSEPCFVNFIREMKFSRKIASTTDSIRCVYVKAANPVKERMLCTNKTINWKIPQARPMDRNALWLSGYVTCLFAGGSSVGAWHLLERTLCAGKGPEVHRIA